MSVFDTVLNFIFPPTCPACKESVENRGDWCQDCLMEHINFQCLTGDKILEQLVIGGCYAMAKYSGPAGELIRNLKYKKKMESEAGIHTFLNKALERPSVKKVILRCDVAVPIPLHEEKKKKRGFNQVELIFRDVLLKQGIAWSDCLLRMANTKPQFGLKAEERKENLKSAFSIRDIKSVKGKDVLLVDDIMTTGTTIAKCASILMQNGANSVTALVFASDREK